MTGSVLSGAAPVDAADVTGRGKMPAGPFTVTEHAQRASLHRAEFAGVDEECFTVAGASAVLEILAGLVAREEPEANGDAGGVKELRGHGDDAIDQVCLHDLLSNLTLAAGVAGEPNMERRERYAARCSNRIPAADENPPAAFVQRHLRSPGRA